MTNFKNLSDTLLLNQAQFLVKEERRITAEFLLCLREIEVQRLFAKMGYSSLFDYCTRGLRYSEGAAQRRIESMRLLKQIPELEEKIAHGKLTLSVVAQAQKFFRYEERTSRQDWEKTAKDANGRASAAQNGDGVIVEKISTEKKREILLSLEGKSARAAERELAAKATHPEQFKFRERILARGSDLAEMRFLATRELQADIEKLKGLLAHSHPGMGLAELVGYMTKLTLLKHDPLRQRNRRVKKAPLTGEAGAPNQDSGGEALPPTSAVEERSLEKIKFRDQIKIPSRPGQRIPLSAATKREVWTRCQGRCTFPGCDSQYGLEIDHIHPVAMGGSNDVENLRLLCRTHNVSEARRIFGADKMNSYRRMEK